MRQHSWIEDVLKDLSSYAAENDLPDDLLAALRIATLRAKQNLPKVGERVAAGDVEVRHAMDDEVHPRNGGGDGDQFLPV